MASSVRDNTAAATGVWTVSNNTPDRSIDANGAIAEIGDGLTTLIKDLKKLGVLV